MRKERTVREEVLLIHSFGGTPQDLRGLADSLLSAGAKVHLPLLPGHGTKIEDLQQTSFKDWYREVEDRFLTLRSQKRKVHVVGFSLGGALGLRLAQVHNPGSLTCIATPVFLYSFFSPCMATDWRLPLIPLLRFIHPYWPMHPAPHRARQVAPFSGYEGYQPLHALNSMMRGLRLVRSNLSKIKCPLLVQHSPQDTTVLPCNSWEIITGCSSLERSLEFLPVTNTDGNPHMLPTHVDTRKKVQDSVLDFISSFA